MLIPGEIARAPTGGRVDVLVPSLDAEHPFEACPYMPRGTVDPATGDTCWIDFADDQAVVVVWEPS